MGPLRTNFSEILIKIQNFHSRKCFWKYRLRNGGHFVQGGDELINSRTHSLGLFTHIHVSVNFSSSFRLPFLSILFGNYTTLGRDQFELKIKRHKNFIIVHHSTLGRIGKRVRIGNNKKCIIFVSEFLAQWTIKDRMQQSVFDKTFRIQYKLGYHVLLIEVQTVLYTWFIKYENIKAICMYVVMFSSCM